jgi:hypothetical protein
MWLVNRFSLSQVLSKKLCVFLVSDFISVLQSNLTRKKKYQISKISSVSNFPLFLTEATITTGVFSEQVTQVCQWISPNKMKMIRRAPVHRVFHRFNLDVFENYLLLRLHRTQGCRTLLILASAATKKYLRLHFCVGQMRTRQWAYALAAKRIKTHLYMNLDSFRCGEEIKTHEKIM